MGSAVVGGLLEQNLLAGTDQDQEFSGHTASRPTAGPEFESDSSSRIKFVAGGQRLAISGQESAMRSSPSGNFLERFRRLSGWWPWPRMLADDLLRRGALASVAVLGRQCRPLGRRSIESQRDG